MIVFNLKAFSSTNLLPSNSMRECVYSTFRTLAIYKEHENKLDFLVLCKRKVFIVLLFRQAKVNPI